MQAAENKLAHERAAAESLKLRTCVLCSQHDKGGGDLDTSDEVAELKAQIKGLQACIDDAAIPDTPVQAQIESMNAKIADLERDLPAATTAKERLDPELLCLRGQSDDFASKVNCTNTELESAAEARKVARKQPLDISTRLIEMETRHEKEAREAQESYTEEWKRFQELTILHNHDIIRIQKHKERPVGRQG